MPRGVLVAQDLVRVLLTAAKPVVAAVNGPAVGGGASIALLADLVLIGESGFLQLGYRAIGVIPDFGGLFLLPRLVGLARARELALTGRRVRAAEAVATGLATRVVPDGELAAAAAALAEELAAGPTLALGATRRHLIGALAADGSGELSAELVECFELERRLITELAHSADHREAVAAFLERRRPSFQGR